MRVVAVDGSGCWRWRFHGTAEGLWYWQRRNSASGGIYPRGITLCQAAAKALCCFYGLRQLEQAACMGPWQAAYVKRDSLVVLDSNLQLVLLAESYGFSPRCAGVRNAGGRSGNGGMLRFAANGGVRAAAAASKRYGGCSQKTGATRWRDALCV
ncbi:hypothetical protein NPIL_456731 [Nephila pilipes]|uniref:Uncharacterized protein n=1 Tax=Nephila pilipes TaxID=299642 RepID=A0A8X6QWF6_NEPPI|nr:hypothetical protein NPIL_456731 [Nephila pilipes]